MVEMEVAAVFPLEGGEAGVLVLREKGRETLLPIVVGRGEADAIEMRLEHRVPARPRAQELLENTIGALGARVVRVEIRDASEALYRARVRIAHGGNEIELEARPSDSVALALRASAPIFASRELVRDAGLERDDLRRMEGGDVSAGPLTPLPGIGGPEQRM
jgi:bifunctional DNase/RNase